MALHTTNTEHTILSLFSGYGGLDLSIAAAGVPSRVVCHVEREAFAAANLVAQMQASAVAQAPIWSDVRTFDGRPWRGRVSIITGGTPCQPFSVAGKRRSTDDERWVWDDVARIIGEVQPGIVFLENVPGIRKRGLPIILRDLAAMGYDATWGCFRASDAGLPHRRTRLFLLAYADREQLRQLSRGCSGSRGACASQSQHTGQDMADTDGQRQPQQRTTHHQHGGDACGHQSDGCHAAMADAMRQGLQGGQPQAVPREGRGEEGGAAAQLRSPLLPPGPDDVEGWRRWTALGGPQPGVRRDADGLADRVDRVRLLGNGVCVPQGALAFRHLAHLAHMLDTPDVSDTLPTGNVEEDENA